MGDPSYDDLNNWDPMRESFYDESFNSYNTGAGSRLPRHQQPANLKKKESQPTKLHVFPLSEGYTQESLRNIFSSYGEVNEVFLHHSYRWAFVTMKTLAAAEIAIRDVSNDPQLKFKVQYAREKSDSVSVAGSETGSLSEMNHRKSEDRSQFSDSKRTSMNDRGSMAERSVTEPSERPNPKSNHQKSAIMNGDIAYQAVPNCCCCKCQTPDTCTNCLQPFCSVDCMIRGYKGHTGQCVRVPPHSSQQKSQTKIPSTSCQPMNDHLPARNLDFSNSCRNDLNYYKQPSGGVISRKINGLNDLGTKCPENSSQDIYDGRPATTPNSRAFEPNGKDDQSSHNTSYASFQGIDETRIQFNIAQDEKRNHRRERDRTVNRSNQESESSWNNTSQGSKYRSKMDNGSSKDRQSQISGNRSSKENVSSWSTQSQVSRHHSKENDLSMDNRSRVSGNCLNNENESWETGSQVSRYHSKKNDLSRNNRSRVSKNRFNEENESLVETQSLACGYHSERENTLSRDSRFRVSGNDSNKENELTWLSRSQVSGSHSKETNLPRHNRSRVSGNHLSKEDESSWETQSQVSGYYSKRENTSSKDNRSQVSGNRSSKENESAWDGRSRTSGYDSKRENTSPRDNRPHKMGSTRRPNEPREFDDNRKSNASPRSSTYELNFSPKKPDLSSLFRVDISENDKFEVKLAESGPPAVLIVQESASLNSMIDILQEFSLKPIENISKGQKCVVKKTPDDYGTWYRGLIVENDPLVVKFIDFSYERVQVRTEDVRIIPEKFTSIHPFCYPVNFMNASIDEISELKNATFEVVFLSKEYGTWNVNLVKQSCKEDLQNTGSINDAREQFDSHITQRNFHRSRPDLKIVLKKDVPVKVYVTYVETLSKKIFVTIQDKLQTLLDLIGNSCLPLPELEEIRLNTMCLALYEESWYRAKIISVNPLEVYFVDFGNVEPTKKSYLKMLPDEFKKIDPLVVPVKFRNGSKSCVNADEIVEIVPIEESDTEKIWIVRKSCENEAEENPSLNEESGSKSYAPKVALDEIIEVQVTYKVSNTEYYVGPENMDELLRMNITDEEVKKFGSLKTPSVGTLCVKMYDSIWSRAKIVELEPLTIYYLDFGNEEKVHIEELYPLPERLHSVPPVAFKIHLQEPKNLPEYEPLTVKKVTEQYWTVVNES